MTRTFRLYVALPASLWSILAIQCLMNMSYFMAIPLFAVYMANALGFTAGEIGAVMAAHIIARQTVPAFAGFLVDRFGFRIFMVSGPLLRGGGITAFCYVSSWQVLSFVAIVIGTGSALYDCAANSLIARHPRELTVKGFVVNYQMLNIGAVVGPLLGALLLLIDLKAVFFASAALFACLAFASLWQESPDGAEQRIIPLKTGLARIFSNIPFLVLFLASVPWWFMLSQLFAAFPLHFERLAGAQAVPFLFTVNAVVGILLMPFSMIVMEKASPATAVVLCYGFLSLLCIVMPLVHGVLAFLIFIGLFSMIEIVINPALEVSTTKLADNGSEASYLGVLSLAWAIGGGAGYYAGTPVMIQSTQGFWILMAGTGLSGFLAMACYFACHRNPAERSVASTPRPPSSEIPQAAPAGYSRPLGRTVHGSTSA
jgi:predicted MFS family arabinose efflux permease